MQRLADVPRREHTAQATLNGRHEVTAVNELFFGQANVDRLHDAIPRLVWSYSGGRHRIQRQSDQELQAIMRGIYLLHGKNNPFQVHKQVQDLNALVLDYAVPRIIREINMHLAYQDHSLKNPLPLPHPEHVSSAGSRSVQFKVA